MNINELEELAKEWDRFDEGNEYSQSFLELIDAYREATTSLKDALWDETWWRVQATKALATAKRLGVE